jgi:hypothetical protein
MASVHASGSRGRKLIVVLEAETAANGAPLSENILEIGSEIDSKAP